MEDRNIFFNMAPDIQIKLNLSGSNYAYLKQLFMTSKVFEPLKFGSIYIYTHLLQFHSIGMKVLYHFITPVQTSL